LTVRDRKDARKARRPRRGEIRAAGLEGILLAAREEDDRRLPSPKNFSDPGRGELQSIHLPRTPVNKGKKKGQSYYTLALPTLSTIVGETNSYL
jgi:hypothetical protein